MGVGKSRNGAPSLVVGTPQRVRGHGTRASGRIPRTAGGSLPWGLPPRDGRATSAIGARAGELATCVPAQRANHGVMRTGPTRLSLSTTGQRRHLREDGTVSITDDVFTVFISHKHDDHALAVEVK